MSVVSLTQPMLTCICGVSLTHPILTSIWSGLNFITWLSLTHAKLLLLLYFLFILFYILSGEFLLNIPCWLHFSYTSNAGFICLWGVSLIHPMPASFSNLGSFSDTSLAVFILTAELLLNIPCCFISIWGVSLTHPVLFSFLSRESL